MREASILFFFFFPLSEALYSIYTVKYFLKIYFQMVWKIWSYFNHFSESILHRHAYAITLDWTQGCFCPMAHFSSYFYITSKVIHLTASKFICSELHIFLLFFVTRSSFRKTIKSFLIGQHLLSTTMQTLSAVVGRLSIIMEKQSI